MPLHPAHGAEPPAPYNHRWIPRKAQTRCPWKPYRREFRRAYPAGFRRSYPSRTSHPQFCPAALCSRSAARPGACSCWPRSARPAGTVRR